MRRIVLLSLALVLGGCANGYEQFYNPYPGVTAATIAKIRTAPPPSNPVVEHIPTLNPSVFESYAKLGYVAIGYSSFNSGQRQPDNYAIDQGRSVGADLVAIVNPRYTGTQTASIPNTYMPLIIQHEDYGAVYFIKRHYVLGVMDRDLNDSERQTLQTNKGAVITVVVNDTPAFNADILTGDIVTGIDGHTVSNAQELNAAIAADAGQTINLSILRGGKLLKKSVQLLK